MTVAREQGGLLADTQDGMLSPEQVAYWRGYMAALKVIAIAFGIIIGEEE